MAERPDVDIGDILDWQHCPVLVLSVPQLDGSYPPSWVSRVAYLRAETPVKVVIGDVLPNFHIGDKPHWLDQLTDDEVALAMRLMLTDGC